MVWVQNRRAVAALATVVLLLTTLVIPNAVQAEDALPDPVDAVANGGGGAASTALATYATITAPAPAPTDQYSIDTSARPARWGAVAVRDGASNDDLDLFDDAAYAVPLAASGELDEIDFVVGDFNHAPLGLDYPEVSAVTGADPYEIEWYPGFAAVADDTHTFIRSASDIAVVRDTAVAAGVPTYFRVVPAAGDDVDLLLFASDSADSASWFQGRSAAVASSGGNGPGMAEQFTYTSAIADTLGLVFTNASATESEWTLYRDTTAASGSVVINDGDESTYLTDLTLTLTATDAETGIDAMRICPDGVCDTETWQPFATTATTALSATPTGIRTVTVEFRNNAHMVTSVTDTIDLLEAICDGQPATHIGTEANDIITGTAGNDVILALGGNDTILGNGGSDRVCGGDGDDIITTGSGTDRVFGGDGNDDIRTQGQADYVLGGDGDDVIRLGTGDDIGFGGLGDDNLIGGGGIDQVSGGGGNDQANGGGGNDTVLGGDGNDILRGQGGNETMEGNLGDDIIRGHAGNDSLDGGPGADILLAASGDDTLIGGADDDTLWASTGADDLDGGPGLADFCHGGTDTDVDTDINCEIRSNLP